MKRNDFLAGAAVCVVTLVVYAFTLCRTVYVGDSGELALAASQLQIAHPPGYPILTLLGRVFSQALGILRPIVALNILSALLAATASFVFYRFVGRLIPRDGIIPTIYAVSMGVAFGFAHAIWFHASAFEVHTLAALLIVVVLYSISRVLAAGDRRYFLLGAYALGLALANHLSAAALVPALLLATILGWKSIRLRFALLGLAAFLAPLTSYLYLWLRAQSELVLTWYNPQSWVGFKQQVLAEAYQRYVEIVSWHDIPAYLGTIRQMVGEQYFLPWLIPALLGFVAQLRRSRKLALTLLSVVLVNVVLTSSYAISDIEPYFIPAIVVLLIWLAELLAVLVRRSEFAAATGALLAAAFAIGAMVGNWSSCNLSDNREAETYARDLFERVPRGGVLFCGSDNSTFSTLYLRYAENVRPDMEVYGQLPTLVRLQRDVALPSEMGWGYFPQLLRAAVNRGSRPVVMAQEPMNYDNDFHHFGLNLYPTGLVYTLSPTVSSDQAATNLSLANSVPLEISDPKLAQLYALYSLCAAGDAFRNREATVGRYLRQAEDLVFSQGEPSMYSALAAYLIADERLVQARRVAEAALKLPSLRTSERERIFLALARIALRLEDYDSARGWFEKILAEDDKHVEARFQLLALDASTATAKREFAAAADLYEQMTQIAPDQPQSFYRLGSLRLQLGDTTAAIAAFNHCITSGYHSEELSPLVDTLSRLQSQSGR